MGISGISIWQLLIILVIILLLFGTKRLRDVGSDLGNAVKGFRKALGDSESEREKKDGEQPQAGAEHKVIEGEASREKEKV